MIILNYCQGGNKDTNLATLNILQCGPHTMMENKTSHNQHMCAFVPFMSCAFFFFLWEKKQGIGLQKCYTVNINLQNLAKKLMMFSILLPQDYLRSQKGFLRRKQLFFMIWYDPFCQEGQDNMYMTLFEAKQFYCQQIQIYLQTKRKYTDLFLKIRKDGKNSFIVFLQLLLPWRREKKGRKTKNECGRNCMVSKYVPVS